LQFFTPGGQTEPEREGYTGESARLDKRSSGNALIK
jgi:hypothetical protein